MSENTNWSLSNNIENNNIKNREQENELPQSASYVENDLKKKIDSMLLHQTPQTMEDLNQILDVKPWEFYELYRNEKISGFNNLDKIVINIYVNEIINRYHATVTPAEKVIIQDSVLDGIRFAQYVRRMTKDAITIGMRDKAAYSYVHNNDMIKNTDKTVNFLIMKAFLEGCSYIYSTIS